VNREDRIRRIIASEDRLAKRAQQLLDYADSINLFKDAPVAFSPYHKALRDAIKATQGGDHE